jgi:hypothetical protein
MSDLLDIGPVRRYDLIKKYDILIRHKGLKESKFISENDFDILQNTVNNQVKEWEEKWNAIDNITQIFMLKEKNAEEAQKQTKEAQNALAVIENL